MRILDIPSKTVVTYYQENDYILRIYARPKPNRNNIRKNVQLGQMSEEIFVGYFAIDVVDTEQGKFPSIR